MRREDSVIMHPAIRGRSKKNEQKPPVPSFAVEHHLETTRTAQPEQIFKQRRVCLPRLHTHRVHSKSVTILKVNNLKIWLDRR